MGSITGIHIRVHSKIAFYVLQDDYIHIYIYIYMYISIERERERQRDKARQKGKETERSAGQHEKAGMVLLGTIAYIIRAWIQDHSEA